MGSSHQPESSRVFGLTWPPRRRLAQARGHLTSGRVLLLRGADLGGGRPNARMRGWARTACCRSLARCPARAEAMIPASLVAGRGRGGQAARMPVVSGAQRAGLSGPGWAGRAGWHGSARRRGRPERRDHGLAGDHGGSRGRLPARSALIKDQFMIMEHRAGDPGTRSPLVCCWLSL